MSLAHLLSLVSWFLSLSYKAHVPCRQPWLICGDFNEEPSASDILTIFHGLDGSFCASDIPTRWDGSRVVDWAASEGPEHVQVVISDHVPLRFTIFTDCEPARRWCLRSAPQFSKPEGVEVDQWRGFVTQELGRHSQLPVLLELLDSSSTDVQREWDLFQLILQDALRHAYESVCSDSLVSEDPVAECRRLCAKHLLPLFFLAVVRPV